MQNLRLSRSTNLLMNLHTWGKGKVCALITCGKKRTAESRNVFPQSIRTFIRASASSAKRYPVIDGERRKETKKLGQISPVYFWCLKLVVEGGGGIEKQRRSVCTCILNKTAWVVAPIFAVGISCSLGAYLWKERERRGL